MPFLKIKDYAFITILLVSILCNFVLKNKIKVCNANQSRLELSIQLAEEVQQQQQAKIDAIQKQGAQYAKKSQEEADAVMHEKVSADCEKAKEWVINKTHTFDWGT